MAAYTGCRGEWNMKDVRGVIWFACFVAAFYGAVRLFGGIAPMSPADTGRESRYEMAAAACRDWWDFKVLPDFCRRLPDRRVVHK